MLVSRSKKALTSVVPLISTIAGDSSRTSLVSTIAGILSTVTASTSGTNPCSSASTTAMPVIQSVKKPSKSVKKNYTCEMCGKAFRDVDHLNRTSSPIRTKSLPSVLFVISASRGRTGRLTM
ncbi:Vascular endothelial zinc finger 1 [Sciurus carolinensis]|uniref:Vascular endothelial zinc finger 1 n=1 Tax=Sciurus carolinensis TaxID=30640 RepID=A0AA41T4V9_SCICA|nr:Vascular endothelial zinc finger 1 [Sciurus carolinensis]